MQINRKQNINIRRVHRLVYLNFIGNLLADQRPKECEAE